MYVNVSFAYVHPNLSIGDSYTIGNKQKRCSIELDLIAYICYTHLHVVFAKAK